MRYYHHVQCDCLSCGVKRCVYVLLTAKNNEELSDEDFEVGQLILAMHLTLEENDFTGREPNDGVH